MPVPYAAQAWRNAVVDKTKDSAGLQKYQLSPRQMELNFLLAVYECAQYDARKFDWNGRAVMDRLATEVAASTGVANTTPEVGDDWPLNLRRPTAPFAIVTVVVNRFTDLLFSQRRPPQVRVPFDEDTEDYVHALVHVSQMWTAFKTARDKGGSTGTGVIGFKFLDGEPILEVFDPRWVTPTWRRRETFELESIDYRYLYPKAVWDRKAGRWELEPWWYRRTINEKEDVEFQPVKADPNVDEPTWSRDSAKIVVHGLGECPVVWIQNLPKVDSEDGDPDCPKSVYDASEEVDALISQASKGAKANSDPTVHVAEGGPLGSDGDMRDAVDRGRGGAILTSSDGKVSIVESTGQGIKLAMDIAKDIAEQAFMVAQCSPEDPKVGDRATATEVDRKMLSMIAKTGTLRTQWGFYGVLKILKKMLRAIENLKAQNKHIKLPMKRWMVEADPSTGTKPTVMSEKRDLKVKVEDIDLDLLWPPYHEPGAAEVKMATEAVGVAYEKGLIDLEHGVNYIATYYGVQDRAALVDRLEKERLRREKLIQDQIEAGLSQTQIRVREEMP